MMPSRRTGRKIFRHAVLAFTVSLTLTATYGCKEGPPTQDWSEQSVSPDGTWIALASNQRGGGMGAAYNDVTVRLKREGQTLRSRFCHFLMKHKSQI